MPKKLGNPSLSGSLLPKNEVLILSGAIMSGLRLTCGLIILLPLVSNRIAVPPAEENHSRVGAEFEKGGDDRYSEAPTVMEYGLLACP